MATLFRKPKRGGGFYPHWYARCYDGRKWVEVSTRCTSKAAAQRVADDRELALVDPRQRVAGATTLADAIERKLSEDKDRIARAELALSTWEFYQAKARKIAGHFGDARLSEIDHAAVEGYIHARLVDDGAQRHTVTKELTTLRQVLRQAKRRGEWNGDLETVMPERWKVGYKPRRRWLADDAEAGKLLAKLSPAARAWVCLSLVTGANASEVERVRYPEHVGAWTIRVPGTKNGNRDRIVPILSWVWPYWLEAWTWLEMNGRVKRWLSSNRKRDLDKAADRSGIARVTSNDLRRTAAMWVRLRSSGELAGLFLGHSDSKMVDQVYARLAGAELGAAIAGRKEEP